MMALLRVPSLKIGACLATGAAVCWAASAAFAQPKPGPTPLTPPPSPSPLPQGAPVDRSLLSPSSFTALPVPGNERNPFGLVSVPEPEQPGVAGFEETGEAKIRRVLAGMRISGLSGEEGDYRVLLGPLMLRKGDLVPQLFADQAEALRVQSISEREVTFAFVENDPSMEPRTFGVGIDLAPKVRSLMPGEAFRQLVASSPQGGSALPAIKTAGVEAFLEGAEEQKLEGLVDRSFELLGVTTLPDRDESAPPDRQ